MRDVRKSNHRQTFAVAKARSSLELLSWAAAHRCSSRGGTLADVTDRNDIQPPHFIHAITIRRRAGLSVRAYRDRCLFVVVMQSLRRSVLLRRIAPCRKRAGERSRSNDLDRVRAQ